MSQRDDADVGYEPADLDDLMRRHEEAPAESNGEHLVERNRELVKYLPRLLDRSKADSTAAQDDTGADTGDGRSTRKSASTVLVELAEASYRFGDTDAGEPFAVPRSGPKVTSLLRGGKPSLRSILARRYFAVAGRAASQQALADALMVLEGRAAETGPAELHIRVADHTDGATWIDMGDTTGRAIRLTAAGWTVEPSAPVLFPPHSADRAAAGTRAGRRPRRAVAPPERVSR